MRFITLEFRVAFHIPVILFSFFLLNGDEAKTNLRRILREQDCPCREMVKGNAAPMTQNGTVVESGSKYPWTIAVQNKNITICGGALITKYFAITAAHCLEGENVREYLGNGKCLDVNDQEASCYELEENLSVGFMHAEEPKPGEIVSVSQYYIHPQHVVKEEPNDIALLRLASPSYCNMHNRPICLSFRKADIEPGTTVQLAGWGPDILTEMEYKKTSNHEAYEPVLKEVTLQLLSQEICEEEHKDENTICATGEEVGPCEGDSGSVVFIERSNVYYAVGVTSLHSSTVCEETEPSYFTKLSAYKCWIDDIVKNESRSSE